MADGYWVASIVTSCAWSESVCDCDCGRGLVSWSWSWFELEVAMVWSSLDVSIGGDVTFGLWFDSS